MPPVIDHLIVAFLAGFVPINQYRSRSLLKEMLGHTTEQRIGVYWNMIMIEIMVTALLVAYWSWQGRTWLALGFGHTSNLRLVLSIGLAIASLIGLLLYYRHQLRRPERRAHLRRLADRLAPFLPRDRRALAHFNGLAVTAGICEEIVYRGYFIWYATRFFGETAIGLAAAVLATSAVFAVGHLYQGVRGMLLVFSVGVVHGTIYVIGGSLWAPMALHALMDLIGGRMGLILHRNGDGNEEG